MIKPLLYEQKFSKWHVFMTEEELNRIPDYEKGFTEAAIFDFFTPEEIEQLWNRSKAIRRARAFKERL